MKSFLRLIVLIAVATATATAGPVLRLEVFGQTLGGWNSKQGKAADYEISGTTYRTWHPHVSPLLDGGIFVSVRIDHLRGLFASDDHASLELSFDQHGEIVSAHSTIAVQGKKITSDVIQGSAQLGTSVVGMERVANVGTQLIGSLSAKMLREKVTEPGRVGFPAAVRHNFNLLCLAIGNVETRAILLGPDGLPLEPAIELPEAPTLENDVTDPAQTPAPSEEEQAPPTPTNPPAPDEKKPSSPQKLQFHEQGKAPPKSDLNLLDPAPPKTTKKK